MLAHTRAAKKHAKILLFSELGKFYCEKTRFYRDFLQKNQFCYLDFAKITRFFTINVTITASYKSFPQCQNIVEKPGYF
jgi:hypothetical protein